MFFRLSKNVVKNAVFGPFGGGYPPLPPQQPLYSLCLRFYKKIMFFEYFLLFFFLLGGRGLLAAATPVLAGGSTNVKVSRGGRTLVSKTHDGVRFVAHDILCCLLHYTTNLTR